MDTVKLATGQTVFPGLRYADARAAIAWLQRAFAAEPHVVHDDPDGTIMHAELIIAGNTIMLGNTSDDGYPVRSLQQAQGVTAGIYVVLPVRPLLTPFTLAPLQLERTSPRPPTIPTTARTSLEHSISRAIPGPSERTSQRSANSYATETCDDEPVPVLHCGALTAASGLSPTWTFEMRKSRTQRSDYCL